MTITIDYEKCCWKDGKCTSCCCELCSGCIEVCPVDAIAREKKVIIDQEKCINCGACIPSCKHNALSMT